MLVLFQKAFNKLISLDSRVYRFFKYRDPRKYWQKRAAEGYLEDQESVQNRGARSRFIHEEICRLSFQNLLEIGCGYGKQLKNFAAQDVFLAGCDFSRPQLLRAKEFCPEVAAHLVEADASSLPYPDKSFDVVLSSAVILHNDHEKARRILSEIIRVSRKYVVHNEDTNVNFSRYGYDMRKTYEKMGFKIVTSKEIPAAPNPAITQFTIAELPSLGTFCEPRQIPLEYH